jgi:hypothetical protein
MTQSPGGSNGAGGTAFDTWTASARITGQIVAFLPRRTLWGPVFDLAPAFAAGTIPLFGRSDFFAAFAVTFTADPQHGRVFHLDH